MRNLLLLLVFAVLFAATVARPTMQESLAVNYLGAARPRDGAITKENAFQVPKGGRVRRSGKRKKKGRWNPGSLTILGAALPKGKRRWGSLSAKESWASSSHNSSKSKKTLFYSQLLQAFVNGGTAQVKA